MAVSGRPYFSGLDNTPSTYLPRLPATQNACLHALSHHAPSHDDRSNGNEQPHGGSPEQPVFQPISIVPRVSRSRTSKSYLIPQYTYIHTHDIFFFFMLIVQLMPSSRHNSSQILLLCSYTVQLLPVGRGVFQCSSSLQTLFRC